MSFYVQDKSLKHDDNVILTELPSVENLEDIAIKASGVFLDLSKSKGFATVYWSGIKINSLKRFLSLYRASTYWYSPFFGTTENQIPKRTVFLLYERTDGLKVIIIPLIDKGYNIYLNGNSNGLEIMADNNCYTGHIKNLTGIYLEVGKNPYILVKNAARAVSDFINVGKLRSEKSLPEWVDYLGYCTWNTFYHKITQENTLKMLKFLIKEKGVNIGFFLLDDGWERSRYKTLLDKGVNRKKFPDGLKAYISLMKKELGIKSFIIWHTMQGYWHGISLTRGEYRKSIRLSKNVPHYGVSNPHATDFFQMLYKGYLLICKVLKHHFGVIMPDEISAFWDDYHGWLASQGVDGVKVDNQSGTELHFFNRGYQAHLMKLLRGALEKSVSKHFSHYNIMNCMSQNTNVYYQLIKSNMTRNSNDYFPKREKTQTAHVLQNSYNNLWCGQFSIPDWDMFQSTNKLGWGLYQAASRAISGSPIYFSDDFLEVDTEIISRIALPNGRVLRCKDVALPCKDVIFQNPAKPNRALKLFNHNEFNSILGIFNAMVKRDTRATYSPSDVEGLNPSEEYAVYGCESGSLEKLSYSDVREIQLKARGFELFTISKIKNGFGPIGSLDKFNSGGILDEIAQDGSDIIVKVKYGGLLGFFSVKEPKEITVNEGKIEFEFSSTTSFLKINTEQEESQIVKIHY